MPDIKLSKTHSLSNSAVRSKIKKLMKSLPIKVTGHWDGDEFVFDGRGIKSGRVKLGDKMIVMEADLTWLGRRFKAKAMQEILAYLDEEFG